MSRLLTIFLILVFSSCINTQSNSGYKPASEALNKQLVSTWKGILPCADCKEIQYALTIIPDGIFEEIEEHVGKFEHELLESGIWVLSADSVLKLTINNSDKIFFYDGKDLIARDENGKEMYRLKKSEPTETVSYLNHQMFEGIDFLASGNEPFWSLKIKFDSSMHFKPMDGAELITPAPKEEASVDPNITRYYAESAEGSLTIQLYKQICINSMSGARNDYKIEVQVKMKGDIQNKTFEGCGKFIGDYRLNDIWALQQIGTEKIIPGNVKSGIPSIEFQFEKGKIYGFGGCNHFFGDFELGKKTISFSKMGSTQRACPDMELEDRYFQFFSDKTLPYTIEEGVLYLGEGEKKMIFKKVD